MSPRLFPLLVAVLGLAACTDSSLAPSSTSSAPLASRADERAAVPAADRVTAAALWNQRTRAILSRRGGSAPTAARVFALVSVAQYDAVIAAEDAKMPGSHPSEAGASSAAAGGVLAALYPAEAAFVNAQLDQDAAYVPALPSERDADYAAGLAVGRAIAANVVAYAAADRSNTPWDGSMGPGGWTTTSLPPQDAMWGGVHPWLMTSGDQFQPVDPPAVGSTQFQTDLAEVVSYTENRTPEQLAIAQFWAFGFGAGGPAGYFGAIATQLGADEHLDERAMSRVLAVMHMAIMDASIGCFQAKYHFGYIRPYQVDPSISIAAGVSRPNFPSYPSGHSCLSSAAAGVLMKYFPAAAGDLRAKVVEAGMARIYAGLHFRFDVSAGQKLGYSVADLALQLAPDGHRSIPLN